MKNIQYQLSPKEVRVRSINETTDVAGHFIANVIVDSLPSLPSQGIVFLLHTEK